MAKLSFAVVVCYLLITTTMVHGTSEGSNEVDQWIQNLGHAKERVTNLRFYLQDIHSGPNPTSVTVVQSPVKNSPTKFGEVCIIDDPLTIGPKPTSKQVGRAQGLYAITALNMEDFAFLTSINLVFTSGCFNGSSLAILGWNPVAHPSRELSIVGGTGVFRLARGFITLKTYKFNATVEYKVVAIHY